MPRLLAGPAEIKSVDECSASAKLDAALSALEGLSKEDLERVAARVKEMLNEEGCGGQK